jgi:hypothetical protein
MTDDSGSTNETTPTTPATLGRADGDWVAPLGKLPGSPERACSSCLIGCGLVILALVIVGLVFWYINPELHRPVK